MPINCKIQWGGWGPCLKKDTQQPASCGNGPTPTNLEQRKKGTITASPAHGGAPCSAAYPQAKYDHSGGYWYETQSCNITCCPADKWVSLGRFYCFNCFSNTNQQVQVRIQVCYQHNQTARMFLANPSWLSTNQYTCTTAPVWELWPITTVDNGQQKPLTVAGARVFAIRNASYGTNYNSGGWLKLQTGGGWWNQPKHTSEKWDKVKTSDYYWYYAPVVTVGRQGEWSQLVSYHNKVQAQNGNNWSVNFTSNVGMGHDGTIYFRCARATATCPDNSKVATAAELAACS